MKISDFGGMTRRGALGALGKTVGAGLAVASLGTGLLVAPLSSFATTGQPQPEESIQQTIKRLFGDTQILDGSSFIELKVPVIAENGSVVQTRVEVKPPQGRVTDIYFLVDKNRRPMSAHYTFGEQAGAALIGTNLRLGDTTPVRAVVRLSDGKLYQVMREVRVTVGGCGG